MDLVGFKQVKFFIIKLYILKYTHRNVYVGIRAQNYILGLWALAEDVGWSEDI